jgi:quercetin dioxygenase-like cupin family protein
LKSARHELETEMLDKATTTTERDRWFLGTLLRIVADASDTGGALTVMEQRAPRGFSPPLHVHHREDTALLVLDGRLTVRVGDTDCELDAGGFRWLPREVPHSFRVDSDEAHFLELATPSGIEGFHIDASDPAAVLDVPAPAEPDIARLLTAIAPFGADIIGPPMS